MHLCFAVLNAVQPGSQLGCTESSILTEVFLSYIVCEFCLKTSYLAVAELEISCKAPVGEVISLYLTVLSVQVTDLNSQRGEMNAVDDWRCDVECMLTSDVYHCSLSLKFSLCLLC